MQLSGSEVQPPRASNSRPRRKLYVLSTQRPLFRTKPHLIHGLDSLEKQLHANEKQIKCYLNFLMAHLETLNRVYATTPNFFNFVSKCEIRSFNFRWLFVYSANSRANRVCIISTTISNFSQRSSIVSRTSGTDSSNKLSFCKISRPLAINFYKMQILKRDCGEKIRITDAPDVSRPPIAVFTTGYVQYGQFAENGSFAQRDENGFAVVGYDV
uniref:Uncharacterized protein n=1 Tax=Romanomermis culicivorax TaxID=13658 RepID=A0A915IJJ5_ROMCU